MLPGAGIAPGCSFPGGMQSPGTHGCHQPTHVPCPCSWQGCPGLLQPRGAAAWVLPGSFPFWAPFPVPISASPLT